MGQIESGFRLSPQQYLLWTQQQASGGTSFLARCFLRIEGPLQEHLWQRAIQSVVEQHEILRTTFRTLPGMYMPAQFVESELSWQNNSYDLRKVSPAEQAQKLHALLEAMPAINYEQGPILQISTLLFDQATRVCLFTLPSLCADAHALGSLSQEICTAYTRLLEQSEAEEMPFQYADISEVLNQSLEEEQREKRSDQASTRNEVQEWRFPFEQRVSGQKVFAPSVQPWHTCLTSTFAEDIQSLVKTGNVDPACIFLATWNLLLWRLSAKTINHVGVVADGRIYEELVNAFGLYDNVLSMSFSLHETMSFLRLLQQTQQELKGLQDAFLCTLAARHATITPQGAVPYSPYSFEYGQRPESFTCGACRCTLEQQRAVLERFKLHLSIQRIAGEFQVELHYNTLNYEAAAIAHIGQAYQTLLQEVLKRPAGAIHTYSLVEGEVRQRILHAFNANQQRFPGERSVHALFGEQARRTPEQIAVQYGTQRLTYRELDDRSSFLARVLRQQGLGTDQLVALHLERSVELPLAILGVMKAGAAYVPIDPSYPRERVQAIFDDTKATCCITQTSLKRQHEEVVYPASTILIDQDWSQPEIEATGHLSEDEISNSLAYVLYTSGSTGKPKGVMIEHRAIINLVIGLRHRFPSLYDEPRQISLVAPYVFDASVQQIFSALLGGHTLHIAPEGARRDGQLLLRFYQERKIDLSDATPALLALLINAEVAEAELPVRCFLVGGEALPPALVGNFRQTFGTGPRLVNIYGPAECCVDTNAHDVEPESSAEQKSIPIGASLANRRIYILDDYLHPMPIGIAGKLYIAGEGVGRGYHRNSALTAASFLPDLFGDGGRMYYSGDVCRWLEDGSVDFIERADLQVQIRGFRIEPEEIEAVLNAHPAVRSAIVMNRERLPQHGQSERTCKRCFLTTAMPGVVLEGDGVCNVCHAYERHKEHILHFFRSERDLQARFEQASARATGAYDCLFLYSGGKDSTYVLYRLAEMNLRLLVVTVDNGFLSPYTHANIQRVCQELQVDLEILKPRNFKEIFAESLRTFSGVCDGCFRTVTVRGARMAIERGIPMIVTALSRGQIYTSLTDFLTRDELDVEHIERELLAFRKVHYTSRDTLGKLIHEGEIPAHERQLDTIQFVDYFRYCDVTQAELLDYLHTRGTAWEMPPDTGFGSSDCLINEAGIDVRRREHGYHLYADQLSWEVRIGHVPYETALATLQEKPDEKRVNGMLAQVGYKQRPQPIKMPEQYLCAYVITKGEVSANELREALAARLPEYMLPSAFVFCDSFSLTVNGKVDRKALPEPDLANPESISHYVAPRNAVERRLAKIWSETLGVERVGVNATFRELGGHSLVATRLMASVRQTFKVNIPVRTLFEHPTIATLAQAIEDHLTEQISAQVAQLSEERL